MCRVFPYASFSIYVYIYIWSKDWFSSARGRRRDGATFSRTAPVLPVFGTVMSASQQLKWRQVSNLKCNVSIIFWRREALIMTSAAVYSCKIITDFQVSICERRCAWSDLDYSIFWRLNKSANQEGPMPFPCDRLKRALCLVLHDHIFKIDMEVHVTSRISFLLLL